MSDIQTVVSLVKEIISICNQGTELFRTWKCQLRVRRERQENKSAERVLEIAAPTVQNEYKQDFRRLGQIFARGDSKDTLICSLKYHVLKANYATQRLAGRL
jgi:hypothetical protein